MLKSSVKQRLLVLRFLAVASGRYAWISLKNCVKAVIGRETSFDERGFFLRQYLLQLSGLRPIRKITCTGYRREGSASQALMIMNAINFARSSGLTYVHTPFTLINHAERPMQDWAAAWETVFNLGDGEVACDVGKREVVDYCYNHPTLELCFGWRGRRGELADRFKATIPDFKRKYYRNQSPRITDEVTVAIHIRRGDVTADRNKRRFTSTDKILRTTNAVRSILNARKIKYRIDVYSNGNRTELAEFSLLGAGIFANPNVDATWTMRELIEADILIMAKSSFSNYAALMSDGIRIFEPVPGAKNALPGFWFDLPLTGDWLLCREDGSFDCTAFERQLSLLIRAKATDATAAPPGMPPLQPEGEETATLPWRRMM
jgi:hypothetical protein